MGFCSAVEKGYQRKRELSKIGLATNSAKLVPSNASYGQIEWLAQFKKGCFRCSEKDPVCLDFHHRDPKKKSFSIAKGIRTFTKKKVIEEIAKCDVLCANCHRKLHHSERRGGHLGR